jgi:hypothetical protein
MTLPLFALGVALLLANTDPARPPSTAAPLAIEARGDRFTVRAREVQLRLILERIAGIAHIKVRFDGSGEERITVDFQDLPLEDALRRLLRHRSAVLLYESATGPPVAVRVGQRASPIESLSLSNSEALATPVELEPPLADATDGEAVDPGAVALARASAAVDVVEEEILALPGGGDSLNMYRFLDRLNDPEPSVRLTALQWLVTRPEARLSALATALQDGDAGVKAAAAQMILDHDVSEEDVQRVMVAAETAEAEEVVHLLHRLLTP